MCGWVYYINSVQAEKDLAKARIEIAHEVRLAKEAEAAMDMHVAKADEIAKREMAKHSSDPHQEDVDDGLSERPAGPHHQLN